MTDIIERVRLNVAKLGGSELKAVATDEYMRDLFTQKQALMTEMHVAKRTAAEIAAIPYLEAIAELDKMYGMMLGFIGDNKQ
jgi:hypothetical protein